MSLTLGENIQTISNTSFNNCYRLKEIIMEHSVNGVVDLPKEYGMFIAKEYISG